MEYREARPIGLNSFIDISAHRLSVAFSLKGFQRHAEMWILRKFGHLHV